MQALEQRVDQLAILRTTLIRNREDLIQAALKDCAFTHREPALEMETLCMGDAA